MTTPIWMLLGFALWTLVLLLFTVGVYRWSHILTGRIQISNFRADNIEGAEWYKRAMRAHANCIENLPVFGVIVFTLYVSGANGTAIDYLSIGILVARVMQSLTHVCLVQTNFVASVRFAFFFVQIACFLVLIVMVARHAGSLA